MSKSAQHGDIDTGTLTAGQLALSPGCTYDFPGALKKLVNLASSAIAGSDGSARGSQVDLTEGSSDDEAYAFLDSSEEEDGSDDGARNSSTAEPKRETKVGSSYGAHLTACEQNPWLLNCARSMVFALCLHEPLHHGPCTDCHV